MEKRMITYIDSKCTSIQRRLQYDFNKKTEEILKTIKEVAVGSTMKSFLENATLDQLPIEKLEDFEAFDKKLKENTELRQSLVNLEI